MFQIDRINSGFFLCTATYPAFLRISINMYMIFSIDGGKKCLAEKSNISWPKIN